MIYPHACGRQRALSLILCIGGLHIGPMSDITFPGACLDPRSSIDIHPNQIFDDITTGKV